MKSRRITICVVILLLGAVQAQAAVDDLDQSTPGFRYKNLYSSFYDNAFSGLGIKSTLNEESKVFTALDQSFALLTLIQLYDIFQQDQYLSFAKHIADFTFTSLLDPRYDLISSFYNEQTDLVSNYRNVVDNYLLAWGLEKLKQRIPADDEVTRLDFTNRVNKITSNLSSFIFDNQFIENLRVDNPSTPANFKTYHNLLTSFIILESDDPEIGKYTETAKQVFNFVSSNLLGPNGEIYTMYYNGFVDNLVLLKNLALYINVGLQLADQFNDNSYYDQVKPSIEFLRNNFADLGVTRGYFEAIKDGSVIQESKSLFSHALLLVAFLKLSQFDEETAVLDLVRLWDTIQTYFYDSLYNYYFTTITRTGQPASSKVLMSDNLFLQFALSRMPLISNVNFSSVVDFRDEAKFNVTYYLPSGIQSTFEIWINNELIASEDVSGTGKVQSIILQIPVDKPSDSSDNVYFKIQLITSKVTMDLASGNFIVEAKTGIKFQASQILLFAAVTLVIFVYAINRMALNKPNIKKSEG